MSQRVWLSVSSLRQHAYLQTVHAAHRLQLQTAAALRAGAQPQTTLFVSSREHGAHLRQCCAAVSTHASMVELHVVRVLHEKSTHRFAVPEALQPREGLLKLLERRHRSTTTSSSPCVTSGENRRKRREGRERAYGRVHTRARTHGYIKRLLR